jgi:uncharacterized protein
MIAYFDTSAFVPLLISEPGTDSAASLWESADTIMSTRLMYVETSSALARANRAERLSTRAYAKALALRDELWSSVAIVDLGETLMLSAANLAKDQGLRGYDAVHCAAAQLVDDPDVVGASGDAALLDAWRNLGVATFAIG